jgi:hypothetical protein
MMPIERRVLPRLGGMLGATATALLVACGEPTSATPSFFSADVSGATTERITGTATASSGDDWMRESAVQVTIPNVGTFSGIVLSATGGATTISMIRPGTELPVGTHRIGRVADGSPPATPAFSGGYVVRGANTLQLFTAESGTVTITETGSRVAGSFTLHLNTYHVLPIPTRDMIGKPITPLETGRSSMTITGTFNAGRR